VAAILGIDWDNDSLRLVAGRGAGSKFVIEQAILLPEPFRSETIPAEMVGRQLIPLLKQANIKASQAYAAVGREHLVCRDIRYPEVPPYEVPTIVQYQMAKELTIPAEQAAVDFAPVSLPWPGGEQRALGMALRKEILKAFEGLCTGAGLTLAGLTPRAYALQANWAAVQRGASAAEVVGVIAGGEFTVIRKDDVLFSRQLDDSVPLVQNLRRSLAAYGSQFPQHPIQEFQATADPASPDLEELRAAFRLPVHAYNPWSGVRSTLGPQADVRFAAACGLLQRTSQGKHLPLDFRHPKKGEPPKSMTRQYGRLGALAGVLLVLLLGGLYFAFANSLDTQIEELQDKVAAQNKRNKEMGDVEQHMNALAEWADREIVILDEVYELVAAFPDMPGIRITRAHFHPYTPPVATLRSGPGGTAPSISKEPPFIGYLTLDFTVDSPEAMEAMRKALDSVKHWQRDFFRPDPKDSKHKATAQVRILAQKPHEYHNTIGDPVHRTSTAPAPTGPRRPGRGGRP
jgi:hypothetical protein